MMFLMQSYFLIGFIFYLYFLFTEMSLFENGLTRSGTKNIGSDTIALITICVLLMIPCLFLWPKYAYDLWTDKIKPYIG